MDLFETRDEGYAPGVHRDRNISVGNIFAFSFLRKIENPHSNRRSSNYVAGKERRNEPTESRDARKR